jgi:predicted DNA-binding transcriptional regulator AlpA
MSDFLAACEVATLLGCGVKWVYAHQNEIPGKIKIAGLIRWDKAVLLDSLKKEATQKPTGRTGGCKGNCTECKCQKDRHRLLAL